MAGFTCTDGTKVHYTILSAEFRTDDGTVSYEQVTLSAYVFAVLMDGYVETILESKEGAVRLAKAWTSRGVDAIASVYSLDQNDDTETLWIEGRGGIPSRDTKHLGTWDQDGETDREHPGVSIGYED